MDMNRGIDRIVCLLGMPCVAALVTVMSLLSLAGGQEILPNPPPGYRFNEPPVCEHPVGAMDPTTSQLVERTVRALTAEFGHGLAFRVTMPSPGDLLQGDCSGATCCEEMVRRIGASHDSTEQPRVAEIHVHVAGEFPHARQAIVLKRVGPGEM